MKISSEKQIAFLTKIIEETKTGEVFWNRLSYNSVAAADAFPGDSLDPEGVFQCGFRRKMECEFLIAMCANGQVKGSIGVSYDQMVPFSHANEKISVLLIRLFNLIYDQRPNANKLIDEYLALGSDECTDQ